MTTERPRGLADSLQPTRRAPWLAAAALALLLAGCGGGDERGAARQGPALRAALDAAASPRAVGDAAGPRARQALQAPQRQRLAAGVSATDAAEQLMDYAEQVYPELFPGHPASGTYQDYRYRFYSATGVYLGVRAGEVYVMGGPFGAEVRAVGALAQFVTPVERKPATVCQGTGLVFSTATSVAPAVGKNAAATVAGCLGNLSSPRWVQTAGPAVPLAADGTQTISFDPPAAGDYAFEVRFTDHAGRARNTAVRLSVAAAADAAARLTVRASQSVRMGGKVSLRAWPALPDGDSVESVTWTQLDGPPVTLDTSESRLVMFTAPDVDRDTVIRLRATLRTRQGLTDTDEALVLVENYKAPASTDSVWRGEHVSRVYPYHAGGPLAGVLLHCVYHEDQVWVAPGFTPCPLSRLPTLAQASAGSVPTVEQVMDRVLVSHDWLGRNFERFLRTQDTRGDFRRMLKSTTAIVLGTQIRPAFFYSGTGAIYLDAEDFWLTPEERDTISEQPDFREAFSDGLRYEGLWRYVRDGKSLFGYYDRRERVTRSVETLLDETGWVLYHELSHALDYLPVADYTSLINSRGYWDNVSRRYSGYRQASDFLVQNHPLQSREMASLGQVKFWGTKATDAEKAYTPTQVGAFFAADLATDEYAYSTQYEDLAMTVEEVLMSRRLGARREIAFADPYPGEGSYGALIVRWGERGRVGAPSIRPRALAAAQQIVPWLDASDIDQLPAPQSLRIGESWTDNLAQTSRVRQARPLSEAERVVQAWRLQRELQQMRRHHHAHGRHLPPQARR